MAQIHLRFYEELNDFLPAGLRKRRFDYQLPDGAATVAELLLKMEIPQDQVELVLVNGNSVDFFHVLRDGDFVSVYPVFESFNVRSLVRVRRHALRRMRFLVEPELSRLGWYLRLLGYSVRKCYCLPANEIVRIAETEQRIILTRNPEIAQLPGLTRVYLVREPKPWKQLIAIICRFNLPGSGILLRLTLPLTH